MATTLSEKPPPTAMEAIRRLSAMVEQAPYSPRCGIPVFRKEKEEPIHWFSRSPEKTRPTSEGSIPALVMSFFRTVCKVYIYTLLNASTYIVFISSLKVEYELHDSRHLVLFTVIPLTVFPGGSDSKEPACNARDLGLILGSGRPLEKGRATHASVLAWRIPQTVQSMGSQRGGHD